MTTRETDRPQHEQAYEQARAGIDCTDPYTCVGALASLASLRDEAAKVPELLERLAKAESERDAARQERDEAREAFRGMTESRDAAVLSEAKAWAKLREEKAALRERVAALDGRIAHLVKDRNEELDRANAAEARVKELEARLKDAAQVELSLRNTLAGSLTSQPPPAPARADVWTELLVTAENMPEPLEHSHDFESGEHEEDCARCFWEGLQAKAKAVRATATQPAPAQGTSDARAKAEGAAREAFERALSRREPLTQALSDALAAMRATTAPPTPTQGVDRERLGQEVRAEWVAWAREQSNPKPSWLVPWEGLSEPDREVDRRIGERLFLLGQRSTPTPPALVEAVGPRITPVERLVAVARRLASGASNRMVYEDLDAALAAYDAAKGGGK